MVTTELLKINSIDIDNIKGYLKIFYKGEIFFTDGETIVFKEHIPCEYNGKKCLIDMLYWVDVSSSRQCWSRVNANLTYIDKSDDKINKPFIGYDKTFIENKDYGTTELCLDLRGKGDFKKEIENIKNFNCDKIKYLEKAVKLLRYIARRRGKHKDWNEY